MASADPKSPTEWQAWTDAAVATASILHDLAHYSEAEPLLRDCLRLREANRGPNSPDVAIVLNNLALLLQATNRLARPSRSFAARWRSTSESYGPHHPTVAKSLNNLALLLQATNRLSEAEPLFRRALAIDEKSYGPDHPDVAIDLNNLALLLQATNRLSEAEPLFRRALAIDEKSYGPDHPDVAIHLNNLAVLLYATKRMTEAEPLMARAIRILSQFQRLTGHEHPNLRTDVENYRQLLTQHKLAEPEIARRIKAAREGTDKLSPIIPEVERLLGPARPVADVLTSLDRQYKEQGRPAVYFLRPKEPIAPHLDELLRPDGDWLNAQGVLAFRRRDYASAVVFYDAALELMAGQPAKLPTRLLIRLNRAAALRDLGQVSQARDDLVKLLPELDQLPATESTTKGRARYHLAVCQWRLGDRAAAQKSVEESLAVYDAAPKAKPVDPGIRQQSEELLAALKAGKAPPPLAAIDAPAALEAARARYRAREALTRLPLKEKAAPLLDQVLGPARSTEEVFDGTRPLLPRAREARRLVPAAEGTHRAAPRSTPRAGQDRQGGARLSRPADTVPRGSLRSGSCRSTSRSARTSTSFWASHRSRARLLGRSACNPDR